MAAELSRINPTIGENHAGWLEILINLQVARVYTNAKTF
jgi:hypothetical protein